MCIQKSNAIAIFMAAACFIIVIEAAPLSHQDQLNVALQKIAELKGDKDAFKSCCNVRPSCLHIHVLVP